MLRETIAKGKLAAFAEPGRFVFVEAATGPVYVDALYSDGTTSGIELSARQQARFDRVFEKLNVRNLHDGANAVTLKVSYAQFFPQSDGNEVTLAGQQVPIEVVQDAPVVLDDATPIRVSLADQEIVPAVEVAPGEVLVSDTLTLSPSDTIAAAADRYSIRLKADSANTGAIWIGAVDDGYPLAAGESVQIDVTAAVPLVAAVSGEKVHFLIVGSV